MANKNLSKAKNAKNDEFYTQYSDIETEVMAYLDYDKDVFRDKTILLPCDDPEWSNFTKFFAERFDEFGIKKLISTSYARNKKQVWVQPSLFEEEAPIYDKTKSQENGRIFILDRDSNNDGKINFDDLKWDYLSGDGDFRSEEVRKLRDEADLIITNPPFSLFREFVAWIFEKPCKKFLIIGNKNAITYKEIFPLIKNNKLWCGVTPMSKDLLFDIPKTYSEELLKNNKAGSSYRLINGTVKGRSQSIWFTNIEHGRRHTPQNLMSLQDNIQYSRHKEIKGIGYQKYDNYDAIEVNYYDAIPCDYDGVMGVAITFLDKYCPEQFEIVGMAQRECHNDLPDLKKYDGYVQMNSDGTVEGSNGKKIDESPVIKGKINKKTYYQNLEGNIVSALYMRIFIRKRDSETSSE